MDKQELREEIEDSLAHIIPCKPFPQYVDEAVFLEVKELLSRHPDRLSEAWKENPRLYTLLRMLDYYDDTIFQKLDTEKIGDVWLPVGTATLNQLASSVGISPQNWRRTQQHVLSRSELMGEDKLLSPASSHRYIRHGSAHFEELEKIGKGGSAEVARVRHRLSGKQFACKRIRRADNVKAQRNQLIEFEQEVGVLKRINHGHTVSLVASFTDLASFSLILNPVAKDVLKSVLARQSREQPLPASDIATLRRSFGCLATALAYLHEQKVRHKDIKPGNILLSEGRVYFCDFGIARDWSESEHSTTEGDPLKFTRRYCAPEVIGRDQRNSKSDIWSLGCVYLEILSVVKGYSLEEVNNFFLEQSGGLSERGLWSAPEVMSAWLVKLRSEKYDSADDIPLNWITPMVRTEHEDRLSASELVNIIHKDSADLPRPALFVAPCCARVDSIAPADPVDSPSLHEPVFGGLGIRAARMSPPKNMLDLPPRNSNSSIDQRSYASPNRHRASRERSVSPRTQGSDPRDSLDSNLIPLDHISSHREALRHIASVSDSQTSSSLFSASIPESDAASSPRAQRSPVPPPASFEVKCCCAPYPRERHIFNASYSATTPFELDSKIQTVETRPKCEIGENRVQVYETQPQDPSVCTSPPPMLWWVTRRLVVSYLSGTPEMRHCSSFWIPLADIRFALSGATVTLRYSDCNQMTERSSGNYGQHYDWLYDHEHPNNELNITFNDVAEAEQFIDTIRFPYEDGALVTHGRNVKLSNFSEINIFDVGRPGVRNYRAATITTASSTIATSKLFIQWPELDLVMQKNVTNDPNAPFHMAVEVRNLTTPTYHSNVRGEPAADYNKVAWFKRAMQLKATMAIDLPVKDDVAQQFPKPPSAIVNTLQSLTGWTLAYFAIVTKFRSKNKRFGSKKYGPSDVMLWERDIPDPVTGIVRRGAAVTFRMHEEAEWLWVSGAIASSTSVAYSSGLDTTISVSSKMRGKLLDVAKMCAVEQENVVVEEPGLERKNTSGRGRARANEEHTELVLAFEDSRYRLEFVKLVEGYKQAAVAAAPLTRVLTTPESMRRINSLASADERKRPPMR